MSQLPIPYQQQAIELHSDAECDEKLALSNKEKSMLIALTQKGMLESEALKWIEQYRQIQTIQPGHTLNISV